MDEKSKLATAVGDPARASPLKPLLLGVFRSGLWPLLCSVCSVEGSRVFCSVRPKRLSIIKRARSGTCQERMSPCLGRPASDEQKVPATVVACAAVVAVVAVQGFVSLAWGVQFFCLGGAIF